MRKFLWYVAIIGYPAYLAFIAGRFELHYRSNAGVSIFGIDAFSSSYHMAYYAYIFLSVVATAYFFSVLILIGKEMLSNPESLVVVCIMEAGLVAVLLFYITGTVNLAPLFSHISYVLKEYALCLIIYFLMSIYSIRRYVCRKAA